MFGLFMSFCSSSSTVNRNFQDGGYLREKESGFLKSYFAVFVSILTPIRNKIGNVELCLPQFDNFVN